MTRLAKLKVKEIIGFLAMVMIFVSLVVCKDYDDTKETPDAHLFRESVCPHRQSITSVAFTIFLSIVF